MALYDPNEFPEAEVSTDFTLADVLEWARTKPADEAYSYLSNCNCVIAQFLKATGRAKNPFVDGDGWSDGLGSPSHAYDDRADDAACGDTDADETFGAFAKRLESALA